MPRKRKVFCKGCKYLFQQYGKTLCLNPKTKVKLPDTWYEPGAMESGDPRVVNRNNDCQYKER